MRVRERERERARERVVGVLLDANDLEFSIALSLRVGGFALMRASACVFACEGEEVGE